MYTYVVFFFRSPYGFSLFPAAHMALIVFGHAIITTFFSSTTCSVSCVAGFDAFPHSIKATRVPTGGIREAPTPTPEVTFRGVPKISNWDKYREPLGNPTSRTAMNADVAWD